jgi:thiamine monophosphate synthase
MGENGRRHLQRFMKSHPSFVMLASSQIPLNDYFAAGTSLLPGSVAGGIKATTVQSVVKAGADIIVVGAQFMVRHALQQQQKKFVI